MLIGDIAGWKVRWARLAASGAMGGAELAAASYKILISAIRLGYSWDCSFCCHLTSFRSPGFHVIKSRVRVLVRVVAVVLSPIVFLYL